MADYRKRSTKRRRRNEANLVGDLFRVLFAVSMLIVAIMAAFFVAQHVSGFSLPELRQTLASTEETPQVLTAAAETKAKETKPSTTAESATETETENETEEESQEESTEEETKGADKESASVSDEGPAKQMETKATAADRDYEEQDYTTEEKVIRGGAVVGEAPTQGGDSASVSGPGAEVEIGQGPVQ